MRYCWSGIASLFLQVLKKQHPKPCTLHPTPGARDLKPGTRSPELKTRNPEPKLRSLVPGTRQEACCTVPNAFFDLNDSGTVFPPPNTSMHRFQEGNSSFSISFSNVDQVFRFDVVIPQKLKKWGMFPKNGRFYHTTSWYKYRRN